MRTAGKLRTHGCKQLVAQQNLSGRQRVRLGAPKAITALAHMLARLVYRMLKHGEQLRGKVKRTRNLQLSEVSERTWTGSHSPSRPGMSDVS